MTTPNGSVPWKALVAAMWAVILLGGGGWMSYMAGEVGAIKHEQASDRKQAADQAGSVKVIEEKVRRLEKDTEEIKGDVKEQGLKIDEQGRKLDELLRRVR